MIDAQRNFFEHHPDPTWIYDVQTLAIVHVNMAAVEKYGYAREEFLAMSIRDICPPEAVQVMLSTVEEHSDKRQESGPWVQETKSGQSFSVSIVTISTTFEGRKSRIAVARDITRSLELERSARKSAEIVSRNYRSLFEATPGNFVVLAPHTHEIVAASNAMLFSLGMRREEFVGQSLFDVLSSDPTDPASGAATELEAMLARVAASALPETLRLVRHDISGRSKRSGLFARRFWSVFIAPILSDDGSVKNLVLRYEDVTRVVEGSGAGISDGDTGDAVGSIDRDMPHRIPEQAMIVDSLREQEMHRQVTERLLKTGMWRINLDTGAVDWGIGVYRIFGLDPLEFQPSIQGWFDHVVPEEREGSWARYLEFVASGEREFRFRNSIRRKDGSIANIEGVGLLTETGNGRVLFGITQDVTEKVELQTRLQAARNMAEIARRVARLGSWQVDLAAGHSIWDHQTAEIHELPDTRSVTLAEAIGFYVPEDRDRITAAVNRCIADGTPFHEVVPITTARGNRVWVRAIGEAERDESGKVTHLRGAFQDITEVMSARRAARILETRLTDSLERMSDAFYTLDAEWRFTFLNSEAERLLRRPREELLGQNIWNEFPAARSSRFFTEYTRVMDEGANTRFVEHYPAPLNGWFEVNAYPTAEGMAVYFTDVTDKRERDAHLRLLEAAVSRTNDILLITEAKPIDAPDGPRIAFVNDAFVRRTGFAREEAIGATPRILQGPATDRHTLDRIRAALIAGKPVRDELINYSKDGKPMWLELDIVPIADRAGRQTHWVGVAREITDRKRSEQEIAERDERFELVAKASRDAIWDFDVGQNKIWWNDSYHHLIGTPQSEAAKDDDAWLAMIHADDVDRVRRGWEAALSDPTRADWSATYRLVRPDGVLVPVDDRAIIVRGSDGRAIRMVGSMRDMTEREDIEARLRQSQRMEAIGLLTGGVAHDFNNLLTVMLGNAEILAGELSDNPRLHALAELTVSAAERAAELTGRLLAFARKQPLRPTVVDANRLIAEIEPLLRRTLPEDISIAVTGAGDLWRMEVDVSQLENALLNLAINARDAMKEGGKLTIECANTDLDQDYADGNADVAPGQYVRIGISDTGVGMSEDTVRRAFEPFFTTKEVGEGNGLGLSMVYGFVRQSGGHAKIYSELGEGTTVKLYFPRYLADGEAVMPQTDEEETAMGNERILVVEDDALVREHLTTQLTGLGYTVVSAEDGHHALEILRRDTRFDLLFTDIVMPNGLNGRQLADEVRTFLPDMKVLFTSGYTDNAIIHSGRLDEGVHLLSKPYRRQALAAKVRMVLDG